MNMQQKTFHDDNLGKVKDIISKLGDMLNLTAWYEIEIKVITP